MVINTVLYDESEKYKQKMSQLVVERVDDKVRWMEKKCQFEIQVSTKSEKKDFTTLYQFEVNMAHCLNELD